MVTSGFANLSPEEVSHKNTLSSKLPATPRKRPFGEKETWEKAVLGTRKTNRGFGGKNSHKTQPTAKPVRSARARGPRKKARILVKRVISSPVFVVGNDNLYPFWWPASTSLRFPRLLSGFLVRSVSSAQRDLVAAVVLACFALNHAISLPDQGPGLCGSRRNLLGPIVAAVAMSPAPQWGRRPGLCKLPLSRSANENLAMHQQREPRLHFAPGHR